MAEPGKGFHLSSKTFNVLDRSDRSTGQDLDGDDAAHRLMPSLEYLARLARMQLVQQRIVVQYVCFRTL